MSFDLREGQAAVAKAQAPLTGGSFSEESAAAALHIYGFAILRVDGRAVILNDPRRVMVTPVLP